MPCYSKVTSTIEFGPKTDAKLLGKALQQLGYNVLVSPTGLVRFYGESIDGQFQAGKLTINSATAIDQNVIKRAYSAEVVKSAAQRFGWQVKQPADNQFQVTRRY